MFYHYNFCLNDKFNGLERYRVNLLTGKVDRYSQNYKEFLPVPYWMTPVHNAVQNGVIPKLLGHIFLFNQSLFAKLPAADDARRYFKVCAKDEFKYAFGALATITHKFVALQVRLEDESDWENTNVPVKDGYLYEPPYYVCVLFSNGKRLPLPVILSRGDYILQNVILWIARKVGLVKQAEDACRKYIKGYNATSPGLEVKF